MNLPTALPRNPRTRISSDAVWPLRRADGTTWASNPASPSLPSTDGHTASVEAAGEGGR